MNNPKVFIIILHYGDPKNTEECLKSLENLEYDNLDTIVIDNTKNNRGFAGGNNIGIKQALEKGADYILLLNNDTVVDKDFLKKLVEAGESEEKIGILGPIGGKVNWLYTKGVHINKNWSKVAKLSLDDKKLSSATFGYEVDYITGACLLIKREVVEKIGLMPEEYFLYCEDVEWCLKARKVGYKCVMVPEAKIWHKVSSSAQAESFSYIYYHFRNGLLLAKRNATFFIKLFAYFVSFLVYIKQLIKSPSKWTKAIKTGIGDFYKGRFGKYENWH